MRYLVSVLILVLFSACGIFNSTPERSRPSSPRSPQKPKTEKKTKEKKVEKPFEKLDSVSSENQVDTVVGRDEEPDPEFRKKDVYTIQLILPLVPLDEGGLIEEIETKTNREFEERKEKLLPFNVHFLEYFSGFQLAMETSVERFSDFNYRLHIKSSGDFDALLEQSYEWSLDPKPDVILGGIKPASVNHLTSISSQHNVYYISPWITNSPFSNNPLFLQLTPGLEQYCHFMAEEVANDSTISSVTLLTSSGFADRLEIFTSFFDTIYPDLDYQSWVVDRFEDEDNEPLLIPDRMVLDTTHKLILAMDRDESYLYEALSYFSNQEEWKGEIYGFSSWRNFPLLFEYFENGNIHLVSHTSPVQQDSLFKQFEKSYFDRFSTLPSSWVKKGYDHGMFVAEGLALYGLDFYAYLDEIDYQGIELFFKFPPQSDEQMEGLPMLPLINEGVEMLHYRDHIFRLENE